MNESIQNTRTERKHEKECLLKILIIQTQKPFKISKYAKSSFDGSFLTYVCEF